MKHLLLLAIVFNVAGCRVEPRPTNNSPQTIVVPPSPGTPTTTVITPTPVDLSAVTEQMRKISEELERLRQDLAADNSKFENRITDLVNERTRPINAIREDIERIRTDFKNRQTDYEQKFADLESRQTQLSRLFDDLSKSQKESANRLLSIEGDLRQFRSLAQQSLETAQQGLSNSNLAILVLQAMPDKKIGGFAGLGGEELIPDEYRIRLNAAIRPQPVPQGLIVPKQ